MIKKVSLIIIIAFSFVNLASAHPGRTDKQGGHTCKTNCEKWGLAFGEYHYHNKLTKQFPKAKTTAKREARKKF